jgi:SAM-dependent methyltransferase
VPHINPSRAEAQGANPIPAAFPSTDPTSLFEIYRGNYATELLTAATCHFDVFNRLAASPLSFGEFCTAFKFADRAAVVLLTALRAFGLVWKDHLSRFDLTPVAREHLVRSSSFDISGYFGPAVRNEGVQAMIERLEMNQPAGMQPSGAGTAFIYRSGVDSAMDKEQSARALTLALAGRARNVAPFLADRADFLAQSKLLLDIGGGTGLYSIACLQKYPALRAVIFDRPEVLKVAREFAETHRVLDRIELVPGDMFRDALPHADIVLLSNVLHDWDIPECRKLIRRCADLLPTNGRLVIHDVFLNDDLDGPLSVALYSAALFSLTEGRAYSAAEYQSWLLEAGFSSQPIVSTLIHCGILAGTKISASHP